MKLDVISRSSRAQPPQHEQYTFQPGYLLQRDIFTSAPKLLHDGRWQIQLGCHEIRLSKRSLLYATSCPAHSKMARTRREDAHGQAVKVPGSAGSTAVSSELPTFLQFPLLLILNWSLSALLYTVVSEFSAGDLAVVSRSINEWWEILSLASFKLIPLAAGWWGHLDGKSCLRSAF